MKTKIKQNCNQYVKRDGSPLLHASKQNNDCGKVLESDVSQMQSRSINTRKTVNLGKLDQRKGTFKANSMSIGSEMSVDKTGSSQVQPQIED